MPSLQEYKELLDKYDRMVRTEPWFDGRREVLVREMDRVWNRLDVRQKQEAVEYAQRLYQQAL